MSEGEQAAHDAAERQFKAKRTNEQLKLIASIPNTLAAAVVATAFIVPTIRAETAPNLLDRPGWVLIGLSLHVLGQVVLRFGTRRED